MEVPSNFLASIEFLPDGTATSDQQLWLKEWCNFANIKVLKGEIQIHNVESFDAETGNVSIEFIKDIYMKHRRLH